MRNEVKNYKDILLLIEEMVSTGAYVSRSVTVMDLMKKIKEKGIMFTQPIVEQLLKVMPYAPSDVADETIKIFGMIVEKNSKEVPFNLVENFIKIVFIDYPDRFSGGSVSEAWKKLLKQGKINEKIAKDFSKLLESPKGTHYINFWDDLLKLRPELINTGMLINFTKMRRDDTGGGFYSRNGIFERILKIKDQITDDVICSFLENLNIHEHPGAKASIFDALCDIIGEMPDLFSNKVISTINKTIETLNTPNGFDRGILIGLCDFILKIIENQPEDQSTKKIILDLFNHKNEKISQGSIYWTLPFLNNIIIFKKILPDVLIALKERFRKKNISTKDLEILDHTLGFLSSISNECPELITDDLLEPLISHINNPNFEIKILYDNLPDNNSSKRFLKEKFPNIDKELL